MHEPEPLNLPGPPSPLENERSLRLFLKRKQDRIAEEKRNKQMEIESRAKQLKDMQRELGE